MTKISPRTQELLKADSEHVLLPAGIVGENSGLVNEKAHGIYLVPESTLGFFWSRRNRREPELNVREKTPEVLT